MTIVTKNDKAKATAGRHPPSPLSSLRNDIQAGHKIRFYNASVKDDVTGFSQSVVATVLKVYRKTDKKYKISPLKIDRSFTLSLGTTVKVEAPYSTPKRKPLADFELVPKKIKGATAGDLARAHLEETFSRIDDLPKAEVMVFVTDLLSSPGITRPKVLKVDSDMS